MAEKPNEPTSEPNPESKPLLIRGDRLLLFLDVICAFRSYDTEARRCWPHPEWQNPRGLSYKRIWRVLGERMGLHGIAAMAYSMHDHTKTARDPLDRFLRANIAQLASLELVPPLIRATNEQRNETDTAKPRRERGEETEERRVEQLNRMAEEARRDAEAEVRRVNGELFHAIASGKLTEADFKE